MNKKEHTLIWVGFSIPNVYFIWIFKIFFLNKIKWGASVEKLQPSSIQHVTGMSPIVQVPLCDLLSL